MLSEALEGYHSNVEITEFEPPKKKIRLLLVASDSDDALSTDMFISFDRYQAEPISMDVCPLEWWFKCEVTCIFSTSGAHTSCDAKYSSAT